MLSFIKRPFGRLGTMLTIAASVGLVAISVQGAAASNTTTKSVVTVVPKPKPRVKRPVSERLQVVSTGRGTYVCSPSGFGSKSKCYRR